jgi:hypothetical protein
MSRPQIGKPIISLAGTYKEMNDINKNLHGKCGSSYTVKLTQYRYRDVTAVVYDETSDDKYDIILCLYHENKCVSSVTGRYSQSSNSMELLSKTDVKYEGKKYNLYLRTIFIYLMCFVRPTIQTIYSHATNPISTYAMYKHYHAVNPDLQEYVETHNLTPETFTLADAKKFHDYFNEKNKQTAENAEKILDEMLEDCEENTGIECTVKELGWDTKEEAIEFIITTMSDRAITLELNLKNESIKEFLLDKLLTTEIICDNSTTQVGQRFTVGKVTSGKTLKKTSGMKTSGMKTSGMKTSGMKTSGMKTRRKTRGRLLFKCLD